MALGFGDGFSNFDYGPYASGFGADPSDALPTGKRERTGFSKLLEDPTFLFGLSLLGNSRNPNAMQQATQAMVQMNELKQNKTMQQAQIERMQQQHEHEVGQLENERTRVASEQAKAILQARRDEEKFGFEREKFGFEKEKQGFEREKFGLETQKTAAEIQKMQSAEQRAQQEQQRQGAFFDILKKSGVFGDAAAPGAFQQSGMPGPAGKYGTPQKLLDNLLQTESGGNNRAVNPESGAMGGYQFMPQTIAMLRQQGHTFDPFNAEQSRDAADMYIQQLLKQNGGDYAKAMAAYGGFKTKDPTPYLRKVLNGVVGGEQPAGAQQPGGPNGMDIARLGALAGVSGMHGATSLVELGKMAQEKNVPSGSYRVDPRTGAQTFVPDPYKESEQQFKRGSTSVEGLTPEDRSALIRSNLEKQAESLTKNYYDKIQSIPEQLVAVRNAREAAPKAVPFTGSMGEQKLAAAKFLNSNFGWMGVKIQPDAVNNAEQLRSSLFVPIFNSLKLLDAQPSEQQQKTMMLAFGQIGTDPSALPKLIDMIEERLETRVKTHNKMYDEAKAAGAPIIYDLRVPLPEKKPPTAAAPATQSPTSQSQQQSTSGAAPTPHSSGAIPLDEYLKKYRKPRK